MIIYTDGSCLGNPGPGGWAFVHVRDQGVTCRSSPSYGETTNNIMELTAIIKALEYALKNEEKEVVIYSDSNYSIKGIKEWLPKWVDNNWKTSNNKNVKNVEYWKDYKALYDRFEKVELNYVKAHNGDKYNEMADKLAKIASEEYNLVEE
jgi:ribonuclease HI